VDQLNVRNVDERVWRRVRQEAARQGVPCGRLLNRILWMWAAGLDALSAEDRAARAARANGIFKDVAPGRSLVDELIADRREEARREELKDEELRRSGQRAG
jgi:hypothetical protein